jgi:hypothetical protein
VILWLLVVQRLHGGAPLESAVLELLRGLPADFWPHPCKRIQDWRQRRGSPSSNTGAYNQARQALPLSIVQQSCDRIFQQLVAGSSPQEAERVFLLDGSSIRMAHTPALRKSYPPGSNQYREGHWPLLRVLVAHELRTGLAMRPEWGPMHGPDAVSEQCLLERALGRLPSGSKVIADRNFGVFSVAYAMAQSHHGMLLRLTEVRARRLAGGSLRDGTDRRITWEASRDDRKRHPELPAGACVTGRLIVRQVQPDNGARPFLLAVFTSLEIAEEEILALYGQRWNIETDLRTLKSTLRLDQLTCWTPRHGGQRNRYGYRRLQSGALRNVPGVTAERASPSRLWLHQGAQNHPDVRTISGRGDRCAPSATNLRSDDALRPASETTTPQRQTPHLSKAGVE